MNILFIGDIIGKNGRQYVTKKLKELKEKNKIDFVIANGENAAGGYGLTEKIADEIFKAGVDCITSGNHVWSKKEVIPLLNSNDKVLRPLNYPPTVPGRGYAIYKREKFTIAVVNLIGRIFLDPVDCPFRTIEKVIEEIQKITPLIVVDFHAEATAEKIAMKYFLNGKVSAIIGTHTHVQTSDEGVSEKGTCYITDSGMTGPIKSVIGMKIKDSIERLVTQIPKRLDTAKGESKLEGVIFSLSNEGKCISIKRIRETG